MKPAPLKNMASDMNFSNQKAEEIHDMFGRIAKRYDLLNRLMTLGLDQRWRKKMVQWVNHGNKEGNFLDLATGTGDVAFTLAKEAVKKNQKIHIKAVDFSSEMLEIAQKKAENLGFDEVIDFQCTDIESLPFEENSFEGATLAFGIRNVSDRRKALEGIYRVLKKDALLVILEGLPPQNLWQRTLQNLHLNLGIRLLGNLLSEGQAYRYLGNSVMNFPKAPEFIELMNACGFRNCQHSPLLLGAVSMIIGKK